MQDYVRRYHELHGTILKALRTTLLKVPNTHLNGLETVCSMIEGDFHSGLVIGKTFARITQSACYPKTYAMTLGMMTDFAMYMFKKVVTLADRRHIYLARTVTTLR